MPSFHNGSVEIAYLDTGKGDPIVLVHGFGSNKDINWVYPGWVDTLTRDGRRVIALDNRGHGESSKLYDPADYDRAIMAEDVRALMDHLEIERADVMGYSMGARITADLVIAHPGKVRSAILGGVRQAADHGWRVARPGCGGAGSADAGRCHRSGRQSPFRRFRRSDQVRTALHSPLAFAAAGPALKPEVVAAIEVPLLIAVGTRDAMRRVAARTGRDHSRRTGSRNS